MPIIGKVTPSNVSLLLFSNLDQVSLKRELFFMTLLLVMSQFCADNLFLHLEQLGSRSCGYEKTKGQQLQHTESQLKLILDEHITWSQPSLVLAQWPWAGPYTSSLSASRICIE